MNRPLECLAGGFVLGEVLALLPVGWMAGILAAFGAGVCYLRKKCGRSLVWWFLPLFVLWGLVWLRVDLRQTGRYERIGKETEGRDVEVWGTVSGIRERGDKSGLVAELRDVVILGEGRQWKYGHLLVYMDGPDEGKDLRVGERLEARGRLERFDEPANPGEFDMAGYYHAIGIEGRFFADSLARMDEGYSPYLDGICRARRHAGAVLDRICGEEDRGIFKAVILGEKQELSADMKKLYQRAGISHLLAISGLHISMIGLGCYGLLRKAGLGSAGAGAGGMAVTVSYGILAGGIGISASVWRAVLMVLMRMWAERLGRTYDMRTAVALSGLCLLLKSPGLLFQAGFQMSFGAVMTLGILVPLAEQWIGAKKGWQKTIVSGALIQLAACPVMAFHYFEVPVYGFVLNLAVIPLMSFVLLSGIGGIVFGSVSVRAGMAAVGAGHYVLKFYEKLCQAAGMAPGAVMVTGRPGWVQMGVCGVMWCVFLALASVQVRRDQTGPAPEDDGGRRRGRGRGALAVVFAGISLGVLLYQPPLKGMEAVFLDVGQGDGICIRTGDQVVLVDGGSSDRKLLGSRVIAAFLKSRGISQVDQVIVSHGDLDHISGLLELMEEDWGITVSHVILPWLGQDPEDDNYGRIMRAAEGCGAQVHWMRRGDHIGKGKLGIDCLYAGEEDGKGNGEDRNEHSLMLLVTYDLTGILLTGDMSAKGEARWLNMGETPRVQVLKAAHHGSSYSTTEAFLERIKPEWAVISCGEGNRYGHPGEDTLDRLERRGVRTFVTMGTGAVTVKSDGRRMEVAVYSSGDGPEPVHVHGGVGNSSLGYRLPGASEP